MWSMPAPPEPTPLRALARHEAPFPGMLLSGPRRLVWVDAAHWESHPAWRARPDGHVLAPLDAGRRPEGDGILIPHCTMRTREWLDGRLRIGDGEAVTLGVSVLRGAVEAEELDAAAGEWWLTDDGRPVLALAADATSPRWRDSSARLLDDLARRSSSPAARAVSALAAAISGPAPLTGAAGALEASLFAVATPVPLATDVPQRARAASIHRASPPEAGHDSRPLGVELVTRFVDAEWAERIREAARSLRARRRRADATQERRRGTPRRGALVAAAAAAVIVLAAGLMWPQGSATSAAPSQPHPAAPVVGDDLPSSPTAPATRSPSAGPADLRSIAGDLMGRFSTCAAVGCPATVVERVDLRVPDGPVLASDDQREIDLVEDYGGVAVLRIRAEGRSQLVVIVRADDSWLVRDVFDAADQP